VCRVVVQATCEIMGGHLAEIESPEENHYVAMLIHAHTGKRVPDYSNIIRGGTWPSGKRCAYKHAKGRRFERQRWQ
jgi:hypothetical protein